MTGPAQTTRSCRPLDVDRFHYALVIEPRTPITYEATLTPGRENGEVHLISFENQLATSTPDLSHYRAKPPAVHSTKGSRDADLSADVSKAQESRKGDYIYLVMRSSRDGGRTWGEPWEMHDAEGKRIQGNHQSCFRMKSGKLGLVYNDHKLFPGGHPGRDGGSGMMFRESSDEGRTWSDPVVVYPMHAMCCSGHAIVLDSGRIVAPSYRWISSDATKASEADNNLSFSFVVVSDDEGRTWRQSLSELFVCRYRTCYMLGEPTVVPLLDGRLLMDLRSDLGRRYRSFSEDDGITWSNPKPVLQLASSSAPSIIRRMPTGELLMIWNQASRGEILKGLHRHRLSCAISRDEGQTWEHFKNLESLDDEAEIPPLPDDWLEIIEQREDYWYWQPPSNAERYHRAPGVLRICYPDVAFVAAEAIIVYDYGFGVYGASMTGTKLRTIPQEFFRT